MEKINPKIHPSAYIDRHAAVYGNVEIKEDASVWPFASIRCEMNRVVIGKRTNIQENSVVHTDYTNDAIIGENVTVGHNAIVHGARVGNNCVIGMGSIVLDGAVVEDNCFIAAGSVVTPRTRIPANSMVMGVPGRVVRQIKKEELDFVAKNAQWYVDTKEKYKKGVYGEGKS